MSDAGSLATSLSRWETAEYVSAGLVTVGCIGEYLADFTKWITGGDRERKERLAKRSTLLLIAALALELICLVKTNNISGMLIGSLSEKAGEAEIKAQSAFDKYALAENKAGNANTVAGDALADSKTAKDRAANAQEKVKAVAERAEGIDSELAQAEYLMSARSLENRDALAAKLKERFKGRDIVLGSYGGDAEGWGLCTQLWYVAQAAEMKPVNTCGTGGLSVPLISPLAISGPDIQETLDIADALVKIGRIPFGTSSGIKGPVLSIFVGVKPPFMIGQARGSPHSTLYARPQ